MRMIAGAILVLAGAVLFAAPDRDDRVIFGSALGFVGIAFINLGHG